MLLRHRSTLAVVSLGLASVLGACQLFTDDDTTSCSTDGDCAARYAGALCVEGLCRSLDALQDGGPDADPTPPPECITNLECSQRFTAQAIANPVDAGAVDAALDAPATDGRVPAVCVKSVGKCAKLLSEDCKTYTGDDTNDDAIVIADMFLITGQTAASNIPRMQSVALAVEEINSSNAGRGIPGPDGGARHPLVAVHCDEVVNANRAAEHIVNELRVPALIGPARGEDVTQFTQNLTAKAGTVIMSPSATPSQISDLADNGLTWRTVPSDAQRVKLFVKQINNIEQQIRSNRGNTTAPLKLAVAIRNDALGLSNRDSLVTSLQWNGSLLTSPANASFVRLDLYEYLNTKQQTDLGDDYANTFQPDAIVVVTNEGVANIAVQYEKTMIANFGAPTTAKPHAYFVGNDVSKVPQWYFGATKTALGAGYEDFRKRVRGIGVRPDTDSQPVNATFTAAYQARYPGSDTASSAIAASYDATYAVAFGLAATRGNFTGPALSRAFAELGSGDRVAVGVINANKAMQSLVGGQSIALVGTLSPLRWDVKGDIVGGTIEAWCINSTANGFIGQPETLDVVTGSLSPNGYTPCQ